MHTLTLFLAAGLVNFSLAGNPSGEPQGTQADRADRVSESVAPVIKVLALDPAAVLPGVTKAKDEVTIGTSFDTLLTEILVKEGQIVRAGEIVAVLDDRVTRAALRVSEAEATHNAQVLRARTIFDRTLETLTRTKAAAQSGAVNAEQLAEARNSHAIANADLRIAEEVLEKAELQLAMTRAQLEELHLRSPFDAIVVRVNATPGEVLSPGEAIIELASLGSAVTDLYIPAAEGLALRRGDMVALETAAPISAVIPAMVMYVERRVDPISMTCRVRFEFDAPEMSIPSGVLVSPAGRLPVIEDEQRLSAFFKLTNGLQPGFAMNPEPGPGLSTTQAEVSAVEIP